MPGVKARPCEEGTIQSTRVVQDYAASAKPWVLLTTILASSTSHPYTMRLSLPTGYPDSELSWADGGIDNIFWIDQPDPKLYVCGIGANYPADVRPAFRSGLGGAEWLAAMVQNNDLAQLAAACRASAYSTAAGDACRVSLWTGRQAPR